MNKLANSLLPILVVSQRSEQNGTTEPEACGTLQVPLIILVMSERTMNLKSILLI